MVCVQLNGVAVNGCVDEHSDTSHKKAKVRVILYSVTAVLRRDCVCVVLSVLQICMYKMHQACKIHYIIVF